MMTAEWLAAFERRELNGARAYSLSRGSNFSAEVWFIYLMLLVPDSLGGRCLIGV
jgi:hypothetical protein